MWFLSHYLSLKGYQVFCIMRLKQSMSKMDGSNHNTCYNVPELTRIGLMSGGKIVPQDMLTTSARFWFWPYNLGITISRKNFIKSSQFHVDNQNISLCKQQTHTIIQQRIWICCRLMTVQSSKWFPWLRNGLWILMRNWVIFLQDMRISHILLHVQWSNWHAVFTNVSLWRRLEMWHVLFTIKNTHLNLAHYI